MDKVNAKVKPYYKDLAVESVLTEVNEVLVPLETQLVARFDHPRYPVMMIAGSPRSCTTLVMQLLIACFNVGYVSNLVARFWKAPYIGALLAQELRRKQGPQSPDFSSELGATYGYEGPHEFGFFWQRWFPYDETHQTTSEDLKKVNFGLLRQELAAMESVFGAPLAFKNPIVFDLNMDTLSNVLPTALFVICRRDPLYIAQSLLLSRLKYHGEKERWFSVKPREYTWLNELPYAEQIAGQIYYIERRIQELLSRIPSHRYVVVKYEDLCVSPVKEMERIRDQVRQSDGELAPTSYVPEPFESTNIQRVEDEEFEGLREACDHFYGQSDEVTRKFVR